MSLIGDCAIMFAIGGTLAIERFNARREKHKAAALIWQLKDAGRITGPEAGKLLSTLYGDK